MPLAREDLFALYKKSFKFNLLFLLLELRQSKPYACEESN